ncbi:hypothetical protein LOD99_8566 [Oopsacas minuta]|uniref:Transposase Tc1-like domain-containing protein n=1 Tax=Oopsacas minuta TaxID=111878 RepID=A0AAV7JG37_9METZ|nr:hypothetical protein LOD99_8566 [Oopsacas minuta]
MPKQKEIPRFLREQAIGLFKGGKPKNVSEKTTSRNLHAADFWARRSCKKPLVSTANQKKRLAFYNKCNLGDLMIENVIDSSESKFNLIGTDGRKRLRRQNTKGTYLSPHKPVVGEESSSSFLDCFQKEKERSVHMQHDSPIHKGKSVIELFGKNKVGELEWRHNPRPKSCRNICDTLLRRVRERFIPPNNLKELFLALKEEWARIPMTTINHLYGPLPKRLDELKKQKGKSTTY